MLLAEVKAIMAFQDLKRGQRIQVDIHDPLVAGLVRGGYLKIICKEPGYAALGDPDGDRWLDTVPGDGVDPGATEEEVDGPGETEPGESDPDSTPPGGSARPEAG